MREIKFRAWDKNKSYMIWNSEGVDDHAAYDEWWGPQEKIAFEGLEYLAEADHLVLMQYTGLEDKHGKEIYEGDILKGSAETVIVKWKGEMWTEEGFITGFSELFEGSNCYEVIGNIYENPELLQQNKK